MELRGQLVDSGFHREQALGRAVAAVCARRHMVGIDHIIGKAESLSAAIERDGFMSRKAHRRGAVLAISAGVGEGVEVEAPDAAILVCAEAKMNLHLMAGRGGGLALLPGEDELRGLFGLPGHEGRVDLADSRLLRAEAAADAGLRHAHHGFRDVERVCNDAAGVEDDLCRAQDVQPAIEVDAAIGAEGLHHGLLAGFGMVDMVDDHIAVGQHGVDVAAAALVVGAEVALVIAPHRAEALPVVFRMDEDGVILGGVVVQHRFQHLILDLYHFQRLIDAFIVFACHDGHHIAHKVDVAVDEKAVIGAGLGVSLARLGVAAGILRHVLPGKDGLNARHLLRHSGVDALHDGVGVGRAQELHDEAVGGDEVVHIDGLARHQLHGILLAEGFVDCVHSAASFFAFFHARKFWMPRS